MMYKNGGHVMVECDDFFLKKFDHYEIMLVAGDGGCRWLKIVVDVERRLW